MTAADYLPERRSLTALATAAAGCEGCELFQKATQAVFGEGPRNAKLVLVGEAPGDAEDRDGRPFVGPAGKLLAAALEEAGLDRGEVYLTNAVKHFKWEPRGPRRLHKKPSSREIAACRPWLDAELEAIEPAGVVCLGATAAQALLGKSFRITQSRGEVQAFGEGMWAIATWHPSAVLRAPEAKQREAMRADLVADLISAQKQIAQ